MNELLIFNSIEFGKIRTTQLNNEPWFIAKDVTDALGYQNGRKAVADHVDEEDKAAVTIRYDSQNRNVTVINESGLYCLVLCSKLENAKKFRRWITKEVIPQIMRTGQYSVEGMVPKTFSEALRLAADLQEEKERLELENKQLEEEKKQNEPKVLFADSVVASEDSILVRELAKLLKQNGYETGEQRLYDQLRREGFICKYSTEPTQKAMELGLFERTVRTIQRGDFSPKETATTRVTGKGQQYFINRYLRKELQHD